MTAHKPTDHELLLMTYEGYRQLDLRVGHRGVDRIVPPAGESAAFDRDRWARHVVVSISPTGRSVRVWVDGEEIRQ